MPTTTYTPEEDCWVRGQDNTSHANAVAANGSLVQDNRGNTAYVKAGSTYYCARTYYRFDTTAIPTDATASSAFVEIVSDRSRGLTTDAVEVHKLFASSDNSSAIHSSLYQTITSVASNTTTDVGNTADVAHQLVIDGDLLNYLNTQIAAGAKSAFFLRNKGDYDVATEGNPTSVSTRGFDTTTHGTAPFISITYPGAAADNATFFGANF